MGAALCKRREEYPRTNLGALARGLLVQVAVNGWHCLALSETGQVFAWGGNEYQQVAPYSPAANATNGTQRRIVAPRAPSRLHILL